MFREQMNDALFERMAIALPYLRDAVFYNLNAVVLRQKPSIFHSLPLFQPAGPMFRLCSAVTAPVYNQMSTSRPNAVGPWFATDYRATKSHNHNGVMKGESMFSA